jgi:hypothetical protein
MTNAQVELAVAHHLLKPCFGVKFLYNYGLKGSSTAINSAQLFPEGKPKTFILGTCFSIG